MTIPSISSRIAGSTEENHEKRRSEYAVKWLIFELKVNPARHRHTNLLGHYLLFLHGIAHAAEEKAPLVLLAVPWDTVCSGSDEGAMRASA
jgi:hypothetical protein